MAMDLILNCTGSETRIALMDGGQLVELYIERRKDRGFVGNIYKGKVVRVLPGMQAAFVDIGLERAAFLYVSDIHESFIGDGGDDDDDEAPKKARISPDAHIENYVQEGQEIMVQVAKDPMGTKGARLTSHITLPGRYIVFMPTVDHVGISRRIDKDKERRRLREFVETNKAEGTGFIVRTVCDGQPVKNLKADMEFLQRTWKNIQKNRDRLKAPCLLHQDLDLVLRAVRDLFTPEINRLIVDSEDEYQRIMMFVESFMPRLKPQIHLHKGPEPIFDAHGVEVEINRALGRKVWLKSGGYLIIDQTEALTAIDVNTGKYTGTTNLEETTLKINLEAIKEIVYQLRLRSIGGIIIIDFIDMDKEANREKVYRALEEALREDKAKTNVLKISKLGLVEMTRKRVREDLVRMVSEPCHYCEGKGYHKSRTTIAYDVLRQVRREVATHEGKSVYVSLHPTIADMFYSDLADDLEDMERKLERRIVLTPAEELHLQDYHIEVR
ncbi:MAG: ribonuclease E/G [Myxococcota bacterium]